MVDFSKASQGDVDIAKQIAQRAKQMGICDDVIDCAMDITACHMENPLKLQRLLEADNFNFAHDIGGIQRYIDRDTGKLGNRFLPRFSLPMKG